MFLLSVALRNKRFTVRISTAVRVTWLRFQKIPSQLAAAGRRSSKELNGKWLVRGPYIRRFGDREEVGGEGEGL